MENKEDFRYTYNAVQQQEVQAIRQKYLPSEESKMDQLRRLHRSASQKAQSTAITLGVIGALIMGAGMSLVMTDLGIALALQGNTAMLVGVIAGLLGMMLVALAYPVYNRVLQKERARIAPEILRLTDELLQ